MRHAQQFIYIELVYVRRGSVGLIIAIKVLDTLFRRDVTLAVVLPVNGDKFEDVA